MISIALESWEWEELKSMACLVLVRCWIMVKWMFCDIELKTRLLVLGKWIFWGLTRSKLLNDYVNVKPNKQICMIPANKIASRSRGPKIGSDNELCIPVANNEVFCTFIPILSLSCHVTYVLPISFQLLTFFRVPLQQLKQLFWQLISIQWHKLVLDNQTYLATSLVSLIHLWRYAKANTYCGAS